LSANIISIYLCEFGSIPKTYNFPRKQAEILVPAWTQNRKVGFCSNSAYGGKSGIFIQMSFPRRPACGTPIGGNLHKKAIL
jgi:hypothetical protein